MSVGKSSKIVFGRSVLFLSVLSIILAVALLFGYSGVWADQTRSNNIGKNNYNASASVKRSYITVVSGGYMLFESGADGSDYTAYYYDSNYNLLSTTTIPIELNMFGCFYTDGSNYYILSGQSNNDESASVECYRLTKYDLSWNRLSSCGLSNCNTTYPFRAGSASIDSNGTYIVVRTCHQMYTSADDGYRHQANLTFMVNKSSMTIVDSQYNVANSSVGYVSHSFNQFVRIDNGHVVGADHGDAYPRSINMSYYRTDMSTGKFRTSGSTLYQFLTFPGAIGNNTTKASMGGFEISGSSYLLVGNSVDQSNYDSSTTRNVFVGTASRSSQTVGLNWITSYDEGTTGATTPYLVKITSDRFAVIWTRGNEVCYTFIDGNGNATSDIYSAPGFLSDCQPVLSGSKIVWYTFDGTQTNFFEIDTTTGGFNTVNPISLNYVTASSIAATPYTGEEIHPDFSLTFGGQTLVAGTDYTVEYSNATNAGTATITITGIGNYYGTKTIRFTIQKIDLATLTDAYASDVEYTGGTAVPEVSVKFGDTDLIKNTDFYISLSGSQLGPQTVTLTGRSNYTGTLTLNYNVIPADISGDSFTIPTISNRVYTGSPIEPGFTSSRIRSSSYVYLTQDTDFTVSYSNNTNVGTATVTITGIGNYTGTVTRTFEITPKTLYSSMVDSIDSRTYTGSEITPAVTITDGANMLIAGTDYTVAYSNNINVASGGTRPMVTITGIGNYQGTVTKYFTISAKSISTATISSIADQTYTGSSFTPSVTVADQTTTLVSGTDYYVSYSNNVSAGTATVTVTGRGNYTGSTTANFTILPKDISSATISTMYNYLYTGAAINPTPAVYDGSRYLYRDSDYTYSYENNVSVGTGTVIVTGKGNYTGTISQTFVISPRSITYATIPAIPDQTYTGSAITPALSVTYGETALVSGTDYTAEYTNNINQGIATVRITGIGNFSGTVSRYFTIVVSSTPEPEPEPEPVIVAGWYKDGSNWKYRGSDGQTLVSSWIKDNNKWYYLNADGNMVKGWQKIGSTWYWFDGLGAMKTGWLSTGSNWYYLNSSGAMVTGWQKINNVWYYFIDSGAMVTGWKSVNGSWYYFNGLGAMQTGLIDVNGKTYYLDSLGKMVTGWQKIDNEWYYFDASGAVVKGAWRSINGNWFYFYDDGIMACNTTIDGYRLNGWGAMVS